MSSELKELRRHPGFLAIFIVVLAVFIVFLLYPISYVFYATFFVGGRFTLDLFRIMLENDVYREALFNSLFVATVTTIGTAIIGIPLAFLFVRCEFKLKGLFQPLLILPIMMPPFVGAIGMLKLFAEYGSINALLIKLGLIKRPIPWFTGTTYIPLIGEVSNALLLLILLEILHLYPIMYLNVAAALANIDPSLEEAAESLGSSGFHLFRTVTLPLMKPGIFAGGAIVFIWSFTDLGTPLILKFRKVIPVQIFNLAMQIYTNPMGYALTVLVLMLSTLVFITIKKYVELSRYEMMGRGHVVKRVKRLSMPAQVVVWVVLTLLIAVSLIPHISVFLLSIAEEWDVLEVFPSKYTIKYYVAIFTDPDAFNGLKNSIMYSIASTLIDIVLGFAIAYLVVRSTIPGRSIIDALSMWPLALPGIVIAFGLYAILTRPPFFNTFLDVRFNPAPALIIAYSIRRLPYMVRSIYAGLLQLHPALEESAQSLGAKPIKVVKDITLPLIKANIVAGAILTFTEAMVEVSTSLMLATRQQYYPVTKVIYELTIRPQPEAANLAAALGMFLVFITALSMYIASRILGKSLGEIFRTA